MTHSSNDMPLVSIVTVNFNGTDATRALLQSLRQVSYPAIEIIVVDNGSKIPCRQLTYEFPEIRYLDTKANLGFAGGSNRGMEMANGEYILLLHNDTEVDPHFLEPLVDRMESDLAIGIVCPKLLCYDQPQTIQFAGFSHINSITGRGFTIGYLEKDKGQYDTAKPTTRAHGAAMMFSRDSLEKMGLMAEIFFLYYEDQDYCERFKRQGYSIWYEPASRVWHKKSISTDKGSALKTYYCSRNRLLYLRRNTFKKKRMLMFLYYYFIAVPQNLLGLLIQGKIGRVKAFCKGLAWNWTHASSDKYDFENPIAVLHKPPMPKQPQLCA